MKSGYILLIVCVLGLMLASCGCTQQQKEQAPATPVPTPPFPTTTVPVVPENPYPNAIALAVEQSFGTGGMTGNATVTKYSVKPGYNWTSPSWRSARELRSYTAGDKVQSGYTTESPASGNAFLFVFFRVTGTGTKPVYAPSPDQIIVVGDKKTYHYRPVSDSGVVIDGIYGSEYDFQIGTGGTGGYVQPGPGNAAEGYLIYEIPSNLTMDRIYVLASLDYRTTTEWKLA